MTDHLQLQTVEVARVPTERLGLARELLDATVRERAVARAREAGIVLPTFAELTDPDVIPESIRKRLTHVGADEAHPLNLFRVHWFNSRRREARVLVPEHIVLPPELTGVQARVVVVLGDRFPLIGAHKVLAAYGCLAPRLVTGQFDPTRNRAIWPSTGNYCRGGVVISRLLGCRGVAILPEGMSRERFSWLERWVARPEEDVIRTCGSESNVKEIFDKCCELAEDPANVVFNQFSEFGNYLVHYHVTGRALERVLESMLQDESSLRVRAFVSATGSAGTIAAGDYLKKRYGSLTVAAEPLECPTMLYNGFGVHNIQGIGDKHLPLIHNVLDTDMVLAVSDRATDRLGVLFGTDQGRRFLALRREVPQQLIDELPSLGLSSICNVLASIKTAKQLGLGASDVIITIATDGAALYQTERELALAKYFPRGFDEVAAAEAFGEHVLGATTDNVRELTTEERKRVFNLGYFTWVEQQGISFDDFEARREHAFWTSIRGLTADWDELINDFNAHTGVLERL